KKISLFVHGIADKVNLKLITAKGHAQFQAQGGDVEVVGDQNVRLTANKKQLLAAAREELLLNCAGAYIRMKDGNIDIHCPGRLLFKSAGQRGGGPASMSVDFPKMPVGEIAPDEIFLEHNYHDNEPVAGAPYVIELSSGGVIKGNLDSQGRARVKVPPLAGAATVTYGQMPSKWELKDKTANPNFGSVKSRIKGLINKYAADMKAEAGKAEAKAREAAKGDKA
ncbi:MAG: DUF2345 domain-containing protein, partial [Azoarcus sp.]|nr:DUF2345 domain-containing protein [Azoarcus sp.]